MMPILGEPSMIHDTVNRTPGMTSGISDRAKNKRLNGVLVRSFIQASSVPSTNATAEAPVAKRTEFQNRSQVSDEPYASV